MPTQPLNLYRLRSLAYPDVAVGTCNHGGCPVVLHTYTQGEKKRGVNKDSKITDALITLTRTPAHILTAELTSKNSADYKHTNQETKERQKKRRGENSRRD